MAQTKWKQGEEETDERDESLQRKLLPQISEVVADCALASSDVIFMVPEMLNTCRFLRVNNVKNDLAVNRKMLLLKASEMKVHPDEYYEEYNSDDDMSNSSTDSIADEHEYKQKDNNGN